MRTPTDGGARHAYLIIAHAEPEVLNAQLSLLDDARNDIYLHIDRRATALRRRFAAWRPVHARYFLLSAPLAVYWGDISQIQAELLLFETACRNGRYAYYHLLSGVCLPLRTQDDIHAFFDAHAGCEFVQYAAGREQERDIDRKVRRYWLFTRHLRDRGTWIHRLCAPPRNVAMAVQKVAGLRRSRRYDYRKGHNWVSITDNFCRYLVGRKKEILRRYRMTKCADEIFLQTLLWHSPYHDNIYRDDAGQFSCMRAIDWNRGTPYTWQSGDYDELMRSGACFARKFGG